jgi:hypothetical protein
MAKTNVYLESKPRYEILDGLRGIAALMVLLFPLIVVAWGLLKAYDLPVREWLKEHWLKR